MEPIVRFATPRKFPKASDLPGRVVVLDVAFASEASGGGFEKITLPFLEGLGERLAAWVDHHDHKRHGDYADDPRFVLATKAEHGACPEMIDEALVARIGPIDTIVCHTDFDGLASAAKWILGGKEPYPGADDDARAIDTRIGKPSEPAQRIDAAIRARGRDEDFLALVVRHLVKGLDDKASWRRIDEAGREFEAARSAARKLASQYRVIQLSPPLRGNGRILADRLAFLQVPAPAAGAPRARYDKTELLLAGQERANIAVVIDGDNASFAASFESGINFLERFGLSGGMPTLVSIPAKRAPAALQTLGVGADDCSLLGL